MVYVCIRPLVKVLLRHLYSVLNVLRGDCSKDKMPDFGGDTPYSIMFGPDICGYSTKKVHAILTDKKGRNLEFKPTVPAKTDELTHIYTFILHPNNTYQAS